MSEPISSSNLPTEPAAIPHASAARAIVFVEANVADYQSLLAGLAPGTEVHVLDAGQDGLARMAQVLAGRSGIDALHIVSHGKEGAVSLGSVELNSETLAARAGELATIRAALAPDADILLYGCDVGAGTAGASFVEELARATGADVAASTNATGSAALGGDWLLERTTGTIEAAAPLSLDALRDYRSILATNGTANGTYDFGGVIGNPDSGGAGFVSYSDKFVISNGIAINDPTSIYYTGAGTSRSASLTIKAEGGSVAKTFTFQDLSFSIYGYTTNQNNRTPFALNALSIITRDINNDVIGTHTMSGSYAPGTIFQFSASSAINSGVSFNDQGVASLTISWTIEADPNAPLPPPANSITAQALNFHSIKIANVSAATPPTVPGAPDLAAAQDSGSFNNDNITNAAVLSFSGTSAPADMGGTVRVFVDRNGNGTYDAGLDATATATVGNGSWSVSGVNVAGYGDGNYKVYALVTSATGGLVSGRSGALDITLDRSAPAVAITSNRSTLKAGETATITFTFTEDPGSTFTWNGSSGDVVVSGGTLSAISGSGATRTAIFTPNANVNGGTASISVPSAAYADAAGNVAGAGSSPSITFDTLPPAVTSITRVGPATSNASTATYTVSFDSTVSGVDAGDFVLSTTGTAAGTAASVSGSGSTYTVTVNGISGNGNLRLDLKNSGTGIVDGGGNGASGFTGGDVISFDHRAPIVNSVAVPAAATYRTGQNLDFTVNFDEAVIVDTSGGTPSLALNLDTGGTVQATYVGGSGSTALTFRYTVVAGNADNNGVGVNTAISLNGASIRDAVGNNASNLLAGIGPTTGVLVSALAPEVTSIERVGAALTNADSVVYTVNFSDDVTGVDAGDFVLSGSGVTGSIASVSGSGSSYTVTVDGISGDGILRLDLAAGGTGIAGSSGEPIAAGYTNGQAYTIDRTAPQLASSVLVNDGSLRVGDIATVRFAFTEAVTGFTLADVTADNATLSNLSSSDGGLTWTASLSPVMGIADMTNAVTLDLSGVADLAGNAGSGTANSNAYKVDTVRPSLASSITLSETVLAIGASATVTFVFNEAVTGFSAADLTVYNGSLSGLATSDGGTTWTATLTPAANAHAATNTLVLHYSSIADLSGNAGTGTASSGNYIVDTIRPSLASSIAISDTALKHGETATVTFVFTEAVAGFGAEDVSVSNGALSNLVSNDGGLTWTATLTPDAGVRSAANVLTLDYAGIADLNGNAGVGTVTSANYAVDTRLPLLAAPIAISDTALHIGDSATVSFVFEEAVASFTVDDVTVPNGTLSDLATSDGGITWTATLSPAAGASAAANVLTLNYAGIVSLSGNAGSGTAASGSYAVDTVRPSLASGITISDTALSSGETATVGFSFTEAVTGFDAADLTVPNGTLSNLASSDGGITWTATLTPGAGAKDASNVLTLDYSGISDLAGNLGSGTVDSGNYAVDTSAPALAAPITISDDTLRIGESATVTFVFSSAVSGFTTADVSVPNGSLSNLSTSDGGVTWTANLTPAAGVTDASNVLTLDYTGIADAGGNAGVGSATSGNYAIDTAAPTATVTLSDTDLRPGEVAQVTVSFSEAVTGFGNAAVTAPNGTLGSFASTDGGRTWTASFTPAPDLRAAGTIWVDLAGVSDAAGNHGNGRVASASYVVMTAPPPGPRPVQSNVDGVAVSTQVRPADPVTGIAGSVLTVPVITATRPDDPSSANAELADIPLGLAAPGGGRTDLLVSLPVGTGLQAEGPSTLLNNAQALLDLIRRIEEKTETGSSVQAGMKGQGNGFLGSLAPETLLESKTLVLQAAAGAAAPSTILINGRPGAAGNGTTAIGLVIDTKGLPNGSVVELDNVDFAAIVGAATLRGGAGRNHVSGDGASQNIFLGAEDDVLSGGGGDDVIGSAGGDDLLDGGDGADIAVGGIGNDQLVGGAGNDVLQGGRSSQGAWEFYLDAGGTLSARHTTLLFAPGQHESLALGELNGSSAALSFLGADKAMLTSLSLLYHAAFGRAPDLAGLAWWAGSGAGIDTIARQFLVSAEMQAGGAQSDKAFIEAVYQNAFGRAADSAGLAHWTAQLAGSDGAPAMSRTEALKALALGAEHKQAWNTASGYLIGQESVSVENDWILGGGNDRLFGGAGNDLLVGGDGIDTAVYGGKLADYRFVIDTAGQVKVADKANGDLDRLSGIERGEFSDGTVDLGFLQADPAKLQQVGLLYQAVLDRAGDVAGFQWWLGQDLDGARLAQAFADTAEFKGRYGALSDAAFVKALYDNSGLAASAAGGQSSWEHYLGAHTRAELVGAWLQAEGVAGAQFAGQGLWLV